MDQELAKKLLEDMSYLRGRFDTAIPEMQKSSENINAILLMHKEKIDRLSEEQTAIKTKVGFFGSLAGVVGGAVISIIVAVINHFLIGKS